jgi:methylmalonyl-CoA mutase C-terminal domain/subunit
MADRKEEREKLRLLVGKVGLDGHDRGVKIIARALRDAGHEVIYTGLHQTPEMVVATAIQEDVDAVSLSILSGAHNTLFPRVIRLLRKAGVAIPVFGGGIIPDEDIPFLKKCGVKAIFTPGTSTQEVIDWVAKHIRPCAAAPRGTGRVPSRARPDRRKGRGS